VKGFAFGLFDLQTDPDMFQHPGKSARRSPTEDVLLEDIFDDFVAQDTTLASTGINNDGAAERKRSDDEDEEDSGGEAPHATNKKRKRVRTTQNMTENEMVERR
jgi:hypothetical protein